jgi:hypothetical protein
MKIFCPISLLLKHDRVTLTPTSSATEDRGLVDRVKAFLRHLLTCTEGRSQAAKSLLRSSLTNLSSVTTPNGPWVYTIVPWED